MNNELIQALILQALKNNPDGLTTKQIHKIINKKLKLIKKLQKTLDKILK